MKQATRRLDFGVTLFLAVVDAPSTIRIYSGRDGEYRLYDDDGESLDYQYGKFA